MQKTSLFDRSKMRSMLEDRHHLVPLQETLNSPFRECGMCDSCYLWSTGTVDEQFFCKNCKLYMCDQCKYIRTYGLTGASEYYTAVPLYNMKTPITEFCTLCESFDKQRETSKYCVECEDYLCKECCKYHSRIKVTKNHELQNIKPFEKDAQCDCKPCMFFDNYEAKAITTCVKCSKHLCNTCNEIHKSGCSFIERTFRTIDKRWNLEKDDCVIYERTPKTAMAGYFTAVHRKKDVPGKPEEKQTNVDSVTLVWNEPEVFNTEEDYYQVSYKQLKEKWILYPVEIDKASVTVTGLQANTKYIFRVRVVHPNGEGQFSEESDIITTIDSPAQKLAQSSTVAIRGEPTVLCVPMKEDLWVRDVFFKTRKFTLGEPDHRTQEKTILLVGATGTGKTTVVDGMVNYILGVKWSDPFRFTVTTLDTEDKIKRNNQAVSQTEWITVYAIYPVKGSRLSYCLNIIDTPGFGDTRGMHRDRQLLEQISVFFSARSTAVMHAICFLNKAPDARLTAAQNYIVQSIIDIFGHNVTKNICSFITFADGIDPPVLAALEASDIPFGKHFTLNNSGLFAKNVDIENTGISSMFWDMGLQSFDAFFKHLDKMKPYRRLISSHLLLPTFTAEDEETDHKRTYIIRDHPVSALRSDNTSNRQDCILL